MRTPQQPQAHSLSMLGQPSPKLGHSTSPNEHVRTKTLPKLSLVERIVVHMKGQGHPATAGGRDRGERSTKGGALEDELAPRPKKPRVPLENEISELKDGLPGSSGKWRPKEHRVTALDSAGGAGETNRESCCL